MLLETSQLNRAAAPAVDTVGDFEVRERVREAAENAMSPVSSRVRVIKDG
jgi:hypothetical protein